MFYRCVSNQVTYTVRLPPKDDLMFPYISRELIEELDKRFPDRSPAYDETHTALMWRGGQRSVVEMIKQLHEDQLSSDLGE